jgi:hypothetical protein
VAQSYRSARGRRGYEEGARREREGRSLRGKRRGLRDRLGGGEGSIERRWWRMGSWDARELGFGLCVSLCLAGLGGSLVVWADHFYGGSRYNGPPLTIYFSEARISFERLLKYHGS